MADRHHQNHQPILKALVNHPVIANPDTPSGAPG
jgi:hypothetical protein